MTADYQATRETAALFDISATGKVLAAGPDAVRFLHAITSNDLNRLQIADGCETYFLDHRAKVLHVARAYHITHDGAPAVWLDTTPGRGTALFKHLDKFLISERVELFDVTAEYLEFHLAGPASQTILNRAFGEDIPDLAEFQHCDRAGWSIRRHDPLGVPGYDIVVKNDRVAELQKTFDAVAKGTPATYETLRIEAVTPLYGPDIDDNRFVLELPRAARGISYTKGCFPGQEPIVMSRDRAGFVNRTLLGVKFDGEALPVAGTKLLKDGSEVGVTTSSTFSPRWQKAIALAYVRRGFQEPGTELTTAAGDRVVVLPHL